MNTKPALSCLFATVRKFSVKNIFGALLLIFSVGLIPTASADLLVNGGFEVPVQTAPNYATFNIPAGDPYITGWTVVQGNVDLTTTANYGPGPNTLDPGSVQDIDLIGDTNAAPDGKFGGISQTFATIPGQQYQLTFDFSHNSGMLSPTGFFVASVTIADASNPSSTVLSTQVSQANGGGFRTTPWELFSQTFTANSNLSTLTFIDTQGAFDAGIYLDDVAVNPVAPAGVPDNGSTAGMMLLGLLGIGLLAHRWRNPLSA